MFSRFGRTESPYKSGHAGNSHAGNGHVDLHPLGNGFFWLASLANAAPISIFVILTLAPIYNLLTVDGSALPPKCSERGWVFGCVQRTRTRCMRCVTWRSTSLPLRWACISRAAFTRPAMRSMVAARLICQTTAVCTPCLIQIHGGWSTSAFHWRSPAFIWPTDILQVKAIFIALRNAQKNHACFCLLDLSTVDHNILITRFTSWFSIHGFVLSWFKSYL